MKRAFLYSLAACLVLALAGCSNNNSGGGNPPVSTPSITSMTPNKVSRGQTHVDGTILGVNLGGVVSVNLGEGLTVEQFSSTSPSEITIKFSVSANTSAGARTISVTTSGGTATSSTALTVDSNRAPTAKFTVSPDSGAKNTVFTFDATQSSDPEGSIATYKWDFGDGKSATGRIATHQFGKGGSFQVILTVTDHNKAASSAFKSVEVANGIAPVARFTITPESGNIDTVFHFDGSGSSDNDGTVVRFEWKFGDGGTATGAVVDHKFRESGLFNVKLTVTDNDGLGSLLDK
ncbi:MAG TPA: PKD domain-containing protein, partial [Acidobacteriota bacterium]|nr:PKD domain-containing protein [Acidobacteriota bacterium]